MSAESTNKKFGVFVILWQILIIALYASKVKYAESAATKSDLTSPEVPIRYAFFQDVHVMIFVGFGFLMTFLRRYSYSAVGYNFIIAAMCLQWAVLVVGFWHHVHDKSDEKIEIELDSLINGDFAAGAVLITFGGVLGKTNAFQMAVLAFVEVIFYGLNEMLLVSEFVVADIGGSMVIHTFGAYFGLSCALALGPHIKPPPSEHPKNGSNKTFDTTAMIGTLFLWLFWPSFNGALATGSRQHRAVLNTVLSLCGSCAAAFSVSALGRKHNKFSMVDVQNATLAGGVAVGAIADLSIQPWGALLTGFCAGTVSASGFCWLQEFLANKIHLYDTCGIHNLHGMPGVIGGIASIIVAHTAKFSSYGAGLYVLYPERAPSNATEAAVLSVDIGSDRSASEQATKQLIALLVTLGIAIFSGALTGFTLRLPLFDQPKMLFDDVEYWEVEDADEEDGKRQKPTPTSPARFYMT